MVRSNSEKAQELIDIQGAEGNWNYDAYMHGMLNGMLLMQAVFDDTEPEFRGPPDNFISDNLGAGIVHALDASGSNPLADGMESGYGDVEKEVYGISPVAALNEKVVSLQNVREKIEEEFSRPAITPLGNIPTPTPLQKDWLTKHPEYDILVDPIEVEKCDAVGFLNEACVFEFRSNQPFVYDSNGLIVDYCPIVKGIAVGIRRR